MSLKLQILFFVGLALTTGWHEQYSLWEAFTKAVGILCLSYVLDGFMQAIKKGK